MGYSHPGVPIWSSPSFVTKGDQNYRDHVTSSVHCTLTHSHTTKLYPSEGLPGGRFRFPLTHSPPSPFLTHWPTHHPLTHSHPIPQRNWLSDVTVTVVHSYRCHMWSSVETVVHRFINMVTRHTYPLTILISTDQSHIHWPPQNPGNPVFVGNCGWKKR